MLKVALGCARAYLFSISFGIPEGPPTFPEDIFLVALVSSFTVNSEKSSHKLARLRQDRSYQGSS